MNLRKTTLAVAAVTAMGWSVIANATPDYDRAQEWYWDAITDIHNECALYWTYDPTPYSNYSNCVFERKYLYAQGAMIAYSLLYGIPFPDNGLDQGETHWVVAQALYYGI